MKNLTDAELVGRYAASGDEAAFAEIAGRHGPMVYAACRRLLGESGQADDAVQAVFMLLARKARGLSRRQALAGWLHGAAGLVAREHLRAAGRRRRAEKEAAEMRQAQRERAGADWNAVRPEIDAAIGKLPRHYREAVLLSCVEGRPEAEIARELGVPAGTVKSRVSRGLEKLRERLAGRGKVPAVAGLGGLLAEHGAEAMPAALAAKVAGLGAAAGAAVASSSAGLLMMEGAVKAMFWMKVKVAAAVLAAAAVVGGGGGAVAVKLAAAEPEAAGTSDEKRIRCRVVRVIAGGKVLLSAGSARGVRAGFEFGVSRGGVKLGAVKATSVDEKQTTAEISSVSGEIKVGDIAETRFSVVAAPAGPRPEETKWSREVNGLRLALLVEPAAWAPGQGVTLTCIVKNVSKEPLRVMDWRASWAGLTFKDANGETVRMGGGSDKSRMLQPRDVPLIPAGGEQRFTRKGTLHEGKFATSVSTGGELHWPGGRGRSLRPGAYSLVAVMRDCRLACRQLGLENLWTGPEVTSPPVQITVKKDRGMTGQPKITEARAREIALEAAAGRMPGFRDKMTAGKTELVGAKSWRVLIRAKRPYSEGTFDALWVNVDAQSGKVTKIEGIPGKTG